jgi:hypothetical protein
VVSNGLHFGDFERTGEETVRRNLALGAYTSQHMSLAREWLAKRDRARNDASNAEQIRIARSAKNERDYTINELGDITNELRNIVSDLIRYLRVTGIRK